MPLGFVGMRCIENCAKSQNYETVPEMKVITVFYFPFIVASFWVILSLAFRESAGRINCVKTNICTKFSGSLSAMSS